MKKLIIFRLIFVSAFIIIFFESTSGQTRIVNASEERCYYRYYLGGSYYYDDSDVLDVGLWPAATNRINRVYLAFEYSLSDDAVITGITLNFSTFMGVDATTIRIRQIDVDGSPTWATIGGGTLVGSVAIDNSFSEDYEIELDMDSYPESFLELGILNANITSEDYLVKIMNYTSITIEYDVPCPTNLTITADISDDDEKLASNTITASNEISGGADVHYGAGTQVTLTTGFKVNSGCTFLADRNGCSASKRAESSFIEPEISGVEGDIEVYPNPSRGSTTLYLGNLEGRKQIDVFTLSGKNIYHSLTSKQYEQMDLIGFDKGLYIIKVQHPGGLKTTKLILE
jgi:hypothetical protein